MMHIGLGAREYAPHMDLGGISAYTYHLTLGLEQIGHQVTILSNPLDRDGQPSRVAQRESVAARIRATSRRLMRNQRWFPRAALGLVWYSFSLTRAIQTLATTTPLDIVELPEWGAEGWVASLCKRVPMVVKLHTPSFLVHQFDQAAPAPERCMIHWLEKQAVHNADLITSPSQSLARIVAQRYGLSLAKIHIVRNPIDTTLFSPGPPTTDAPPMVLYAGRWNTRKGVQVLAQAIPLVLKACPDTLFAFVGSASPAASCNPRDYQHELMTSLHDLGVADRVRFYPRQPRQAMVALYRASALCVIPSLYDNLPYTALEAMACGKPVVASDVGGLSELISPGVNGCLVPPGQPVALAEALIDLLGHPGRRQAMGEQARCYVEAQLSCAHIATTTAQLYQRTIQAWRTATA